MQLPSFFRQKTGATPKSNPLAAKAFPTDSKMAPDSRFSSGYLFGRYGRKKGDLSVEIKFERKHGLRDAWTYADTPLERYASEGYGLPKPPRPNVKELLAQAALSSGGNHEPIRVLDIGVGTGKNIDLAFFEMLNIKFDCTSLAMAGDMAPGISRIVTLAQANDLHLKFAPASYDFVLSHYGVHKQLCPAIENIMFLLKPGGEALLSGDYDTSAFKKCTDCRNPIYTIKAFDPPVKEKGGHWFLWLQKIS
jgi:SAM-dependent methyltransferase